MYTLLLAFGVTLFIAIVPMAFGVSAAWTVLPGLAAGIAAFIWMSRRLSRRVQAVTEAADQELAALQQIAQRPGPAAQAQMAHRFDRAVQILERGFAFEKWQFGVSTMLNARIGMLLFSRSLILPNANPADAIPYLEKARVRGRKGKLLQGLWPAWAMLAVAYFKGRKDVDRAVAVLEDAVKAANKEGLLWNLYAWILWKADRLDDAIAVLARAKENLPDDGRVAENLNALRNRKAMKMRAYGEQWYQFGLEKPRLAGMQPQMAHPRARGGMRRR